ncbi:MAG: ADP/ATP carrier protein [Watsoniomyces obsoletus]|nr:MAG: ADP/ATP carrier protein [Watsoniomyces obsoletus]
MAPKTSSARSLEAEATAIASGIGNPPSTQRDLDLSIRSSELLLEAVQLAGCDAERIRLRKKCQALLNQAERIKKILRERESNGGTTPPRITPPLPLPGSISKGTVLVPKSMMAQKKLSTKEQVILLKSSKLNGFVFPPWTSAPESAEFSLPLTKEKFVDTPALRLSEEQLSHFAGWKRPDEIFCGDGETLGRSQRQVPTMIATQKSDFIQDVTSDCSVVAGLCAIAALPGEVLSKASPGLLSTIIYPLDKNGKHPVVSSNGKYILRLYFNGCYRKVIIDDLLPASKSDRMLYVVDGANASLLWPALLEKSYLKVRRAGYDVDGSNSGTDFPETSPEEVWRRCRQHWSTGNVLITAGTGALTPEETAAYGLQSNHDYAVVGLGEDGPSCWFLVKNPWGSGGGSSSIIINSNAQHGVVSSQDTTTMEALDQATSNLSVLGRGLFYINPDRMMQLFQTINLNWNPDLFSHRQDRHFTWVINGNDAASSFRCNPQWSLYSAQGGPMWLLLSRHFPAEEGDGSQSQTKMAEDIHHTTGGEGPPTGLISLYLFSHTMGRRVLLSSGSIQQTPYVDTPQTLLTFDIPEQQQQDGSYYTIVASQEHYMPGTLHNLTLSAFGENPFFLRQAQDPYPFRSSLMFHWPYSYIPSIIHPPPELYFITPQFMISVSEPTNLAIMLEISEEDATASVIMVRTPPCQPGWRGRIERVSRIAPRDVIQFSTKHSSGGYCSVDEYKDVDEGNYTLILSIPGTFSYTRRPRFTLSVGSSACGCKIQPVLPAEAGRFRNCLDPVKFEPGQTTKVAQVFFPHMTQTRMLARWPPPHVSPTHHLSLSESSGRMVGGKRPIKSPVRISLRLSPPKTPTLIEPSRNTNRPGSTSSSGSFTLDPLAGYSNMAVPDTTPEQNNIIVTADNFDDFPSLVPNLNPDGHGQNQDADGIDSNGEEMQYTVTDGLLRAKDFLFNPQMHNYSQLRQSAELSGPQRPGEDDMGIAYVVIERIIRPSSCRDRPAGTGSGGAATSAAAAAAGVGSSSTTGVEGDRPTWSGERTRYIIDPDDETEDEGEERDGGDQEDEGIVDDDNDEDASTIHLSDIEDEDDDDDDEMDVDDDDNNNQDENEENQDQDQDQDQAGGGEVNAGVTGKRKGKGKGKGKQKEKLTRKDDKDGEGEEKDEEDQYETIAIDFLSDREIIVRGAWFSPWDE